MAKKIIIDGVIGTKEGEISSSAFRAMLPTTGEPIELYIHSEGGSVFEGFRIYDLLKEYPGAKKAVIQSSAFSIASFVPMACDEIEIAPNGFMMIHNPYTIAEGDDEELIKTATLMAQLKENMVNAYAQKTGKTTEEITALLRRETYLDAHQCVAMGFCDRVSGQPVVGRIFNQIKDMPHGVYTALFGVGTGGNKDESRKVKNTMSESVNPVAATVEEIEAQFPKLKPTTILACLKQKMPLAQVAQAAMEETMTENQTLAAKCQELEQKCLAMEQEMLALKAQLMPTEEEAPAVVAPVQEEQSRASAGVVAVAKATTAGPTATAKWNDEIQARVSRGMSKAQAALDVDKTFPDLRARFVSEVSARRTVSAR